MVLDKRHYITAEKSIVDFNFDTNVIERFRDIICINYGINRNFLISYEVAVGKAFFRIISKDKYSCDILRYIDKYEEIKDLARRIDGKMKYGENSSKLLYTKSYLIAVMISLLAIVIASFVNESDFDFDCIFVIVLIIYSMFISFVGALIVIAVEHIKDYIIKLI